MARLLSVVATVSAQKPVEAVPEDCSIGCTRPVYNLLRLLAPANLPMNIDGLQAQETTTRHSKVQPSPFHSDQQLLGVDAESVASTVLSSAMIRH